MASNPPPNHENDEFWRDYLTSGSPAERRARRILNRFPREPRCTVCAAPFAGLGAPLMRMIGKRQSRQSPKMCDGCYEVLASHHGGAEITLHVGPVSR